MYRKIIILILSIFVISCTDTQIVGGVRTLNNILGSNKPKLREIKNSFRSSKKYIPYGLNVEYSKIEDVNYEIYSKNNKKDSLIFLLHGGSFDSRLHNGYRKLVEKMYKYNSNFDIILVDYKTGSKNPYPQSTIDSMKVLKEVEKDYKNIYIFGDSAGGNIALTLMFSMDKNIKDKVRAMVLYSPFLDLTYSLSSRFLNVRKDIVIGNRDTKYRVPDLLEYMPYFKDVDNKFNPMVSPIFGDFSNFVPVYITVDIDEVLYDDALYLHKKIPNSILKVYEGYFHDFEVILILKEAEKEIKETMDFLENMDIKWRSNIEKSN